MVCHFSFKIIKRRLSAFVVSNVIVVVTDYLTLDCSSVRFVGSDMQQDQEADKQGQHESEATNSICEAMASYWGRLETHKEWTGKKPPIFHFMKAVNST